jgi:mannose-1-phosphate guanylyltransferase
MKAIILVGGLGTRLRPLTLATPKPMVPVLNSPFLEDVLLRLKAFGVLDVVLALSHLAPAIEGFFGSGERLGMHLSYMVEPSPLGTAGAVRNAAQCIDDTCFVLNGDIYSGLNLAAMLDFHRARKAQVTIALTAVDNPGAFGLVETEGGGRVRRFLEKPKPSEITTDMINAGTYLIEPAVLDYLSPGVVCSFERQVFPALLAGDAPVYGFADHSYWIDIGTPANYQQLNNDLLCGKGGQNIFLHGNEIVAGPGCQIHPTADLRGPLLLGEGTIIAEEAALIGPCVLGPGCRIEARATVTSSVLWRAVSVGEAASVEKSIIANDSRLAAGGALEGVTVGDHLSLPRGYRYVGGQIWPTQWQ